MTGRVTWRYRDSFYGGAAVGDAPTARTASSRAIWDVFLDGTGYMLDFEKQQNLTLETVAMQRAQQTTQSEPGEQTINPEGLWRRSQSSWHDGAGQTARDRTSTDGYRAHTVSDSYRFRSSRGVNPWTPWSLSLLRDTTLVQSVVGSNTHVASTAGYVYFCDGTSMYRTDGTTNTVVTGIPSASTGVVSAGSQVLSAHGTSGIYLVAAGATVASSWVTGTVSTVGYAKGRVMAAAGASVYNVTTSFASTGALPAVLFTHPDPSFVWAGFAEGKAWVFAAGNAGNIGLVYRISVKADGTGLDVPLVAGELPKGETITNIFGYLGSVFVCTTRGFRFCAVDGSGNLAIGRLVEVGAVYAMDGWGQYVYFGWSNLDGSYTGVGRIDPTILTDTDGLVPAYASDLMAVGQGTVRGVAVLGGSPVFGVDGLGFYAAHPTDLVPSGFVDSGDMAFGLGEDKVATGANVAWTGDGDVSVSHSYNDRAFTPIGSGGAQRRGTTHEVRLTLTRDVLHTGGPNVTAWTLFVVPTSTPTLIRQLAVEWAEAVLTRDGVEQSMQLSGLRSRVTEMWRNQELVTFQDGASASTVVVQDFKFVYDRESSLNTREWCGVLFLKLKEVT